MKVIKGFENNCVFREIHFSINRNADEYFAEFIHTPLEVFLPGTKKISGVARTENMTEKPFPEIGAIRKVYLKDGESALEEVLDLQPRHLRYKVSDYTLLQAKPIEYGIGEFKFMPIGPSSMLVSWRYSFKLKYTMFPGNLGWFGRTLFRLSFLDRDYAEYMNASIAAITSHAEVLFRGFTFDC